MHTFMRCGDAHNVGYYQNRGSSPAIFVTLFKQLSFYTAFNVTCVLNGGAGDMSKETLKVLEMCQSKEKTT